LGAIDKLKLDGDWAVGANIVRKSLLAPTRLIAENAGQEGSIVVQKVLEMKQDEGFNARTDTYEDLVENGVLDPTKVVRIALENAASIAALLLTTEAIVTDKPEEDKMPPMPAGGAVSPTGS
ncbi:MAG: chaperonin GroEL, partial [Candidatus Latescibacteria bacterium]|nr:chaperonin GroEL [Candidatus Latescibacterota bacterium]